MLHLSAVGPDMHNIRAKNITWKCALIQKLINLQYSIYLVEKSAVILVVCLPVLLHHLCSNLHCFDCNNCNINAGFVSPSMAFLQCEHVGRLRYWLLTLTMTVVLGAKGVKSLRFGLFTRKARLSFSPCPPRPRFCHSAQWRMQNLSKKKKEETSWRFRAPLSAILL